MVGGHYRDVGQPFSAFLLYLLLVKPYGGLRLLQQNVVRPRHVLPFVLRERLYLLFQHCGVRLYFRPFGQMQCGNELEVGCGACVPCPCQLKVQLFLLQLIARDVVLQDGALLPFCLHVGNHLVGQPYVVLQHFDVIVQLVQVQVMPEKQETHFLNVLLQVEFRQLFAEFGLPDAAADGTSGIDYLLRLNGEVVAEVGHVNRHRVAEIPVPNLPVAKITGRKRHVYVGQPLCLGCFQGFTGGFSPGSVSLDAFALCVGKA